MEHINQVKETGSGLMEAIGSGIQEIKQVSNQDLESTALKWPVTIGTIQIAATDEGPFAQFHK